MIYLRSNILQAVGCALNVYGFGESIASLVVTGVDQWAARGFAIAALVLLACINVAGVKWVIKLQFVLLLVILLAALDFFVGSLTGGNPGKCIDGSRK